MNNSTAEYFARAAEGAALIRLFTHWVKRRYKRDEDIIPLIGAGLEFFNPER